MIFALALFPALVFADAELKGTVVKVDKVKNQLVVRTDKGEETLLLAGRTKGMANAKEGAKVAIKDSEKDGQPRVAEITLQEGGTSRFSYTLPSESPSRPDGRFETTVTAAGFTAIEEQRNDGDQRPVS